MSIGGLHLRPTWLDVQAKIKRYVQAATPSGSWREPYLVYDKDLGWTVGSGRSSKNGLYHSSVEGIRSLKPSVVFAKKRPKYRIALFGDSNVFGLEVELQNSWGYLLEQKLGNDFQILNFGVNGYGIDQAYLRLRREVRDWLPDLVIFGFIQHDLFRSMAVYTFISFPSWQLPFAKPRFVLKENHLMLLSPGPTQPFSILSVTSVHDLPNISFDLGYHQIDWSWQLNWAPLLVRYFMSIFPRYPELPPQVASEAIIALNSQLLQEFHHLTITEGAIPLLTYFPTNGAGDFAATKNQSNTPFIRRTMQRSGLPFFDLTSCLEKVKPQERWVPSGSHFSSVANAAIANCLAPRVLELLESSK